MTRRGYLPQKAVTIVMESGDEAMIESVKATADQALATGENAQQMVRNRDGRLDAVEDTAHTLQQVTDDHAARMAASVQDREDLRARQDDHDATLTRLAGNVTDTVARVEQLERTPGPEGKSAYQVAVANGFTGTEAQWLATLTGPTDPAVAEGLATRIATLENTRTIGFGLAATPTLALLATTDITVPLSRTMPDTDYTIELGKSAHLRDDMLTLKAKTRTTVVYTLRAVIAVTAGTVAVLARYP